MIYGSARMRSPWFSNRWVLIAADGSTLAHARRHGRIHVSAVEMADGSRLILEPHGNGVVRARDESGEVATITRTSWWGRHWEMSSPDFAFDLVSHPVPRRWHLMLGNMAMATISGSPVSYNGVKVDAPIAVPALAVLMAWHVIARPWEAAAEPRALIPVPGRKE